MSQRFSDGGSTPPASTNLYASNRQSAAGLGGLKYESLSGARFSLCGLFFPILRWRVRFEGMNETRRDPGYFIDSGQERSLIGSRRFVKTADFSHELKRRSPNLFGGDGRIKIEKCFDIPAHSSDLSDTWLTLCTALLTAEIWLLFRPFQLKSGLMLRQPSLPPWK